MTVFSKSAQVQFWAGSATPAFSNAAASSTIVCELLPRLIAYILLLMRPPSMVFLATVERLMVLSAMKSSIGLSRLFVTHCDQTHSPAASDQAVRRRWPQWSSW